MAIGLDLITKANQALDFISEVGPRKVAITGIGKSRLYDFLKDRSKLGEASLATILKMIEFYQLRKGISIEDSKKFYRTQKAILAAMSNVKSDDEEANEVLQYFKKELQLRDSQLVWDLITEVKLQKKGTTH